MKLLLVTTVDKLAEKFAALNPELEYCAAIVDEVEPAKEILAQVGLSQVPLYPMSELQKRVETLDYDYVLLVQDKFYGTGIIKKLQSYGLPTEKLISFAELTNTKNWQTERHLRYYHNHAQDFEMFATGTSYTETAIDIRQFKYKTINFGTSSQDLYYSFQIAKSVILCGGGIVRYVMPSSDWLRMFFISICQRHTYLKAVSCLISLLLTIYIISPCLSTFTKVCSARNG